MICCCFFQAEDGIRDLVRSRGLGDVYKRQHHSDPKARDQSAKDGREAGHEKSNRDCHQRDDEDLSLIHI